MNMQVLDCFTAKNNKMIFLINKKGEISTSGPRITYIRNSISGGIGTSMFRQRY
jgi:hypothetical protein